LLDTITQVGHGIYLFMTRHQFKNNMRNEETYKLMALPLLPILKPSIIRTVRKAQHCPANSNPIKLNPGVSPCVTGQKKFTSVNSMKSTGAIPVNLPRYGLGVPSVRRLCALEASIISLMPLRIEKPCSVTPPIVERTMRMKASDLDMLEG
jgi:hypothetical protein